VTTLLDPTRRSTSSRPPLGLHIDGDAELVAAVVVVETPTVGVGVLHLFAVVAGLALIDRQESRTVDATPVLDLDHFGAEVREQSGRHRADTHPAEVSNAHTCQRSDPLDGPPITRMLWHIRGGHGLAHFQKG
jgi:hypothetical protein